MQRAQEGKEQLPGSSTRNLPADGLSRSLSRQNSLLAPGASGHFSRCLLPVSGTLAVCLVD